MAFGDRVGIVRFCGTPKDKGKIMNRLSLNDAQAKAYLDILTKQRMLMLNNDQYVMTRRGQSYVSTFERIRKIKS